MRDRDLLNAVKWRCTSRDVMHGVKDVGAVVSRTTLIADAYYDAFENDEALLVLKRLSSNFPGPNGTVAVFTRVPVRSFLSGIC